MQTASQQQNILSDILYATDEEMPDTAQQKELATLFYLHDTPSVSRGKRIRKPMRKTRMKKKITTYFTEEVLDGLEKVKTELQMFFPEKTKNTFSRSRLLETTVALLLKELKDTKSYIKLINALLQEK